MPLRTPPKSAMMCKGGNGNSRSSSSSSRTSTKKIVIKPFRKPPTLPENYYERTVQQLLEGTLCVIKGDGEQQQRQRIHNVQELYTSCQHLVSHQYGPRLYADLRQSMTQAAAMVLDPSSLASLASSSSSSTASEPLLKYIPQQYQLYTEYLTICRHVFMSLDRTHSWQLTAQKAIPARHPSTTLLTLWQVGLQVFGARLSELEQLDVKLYQEWFRVLITEWSDGDSSCGGSSSGIMAPSDVTQRAGQLQAVWYLWQDIGLLQTLPLQQDLEAYWSGKSQEWASEADLLSTSGGCYRAALFLQWLYAKHVKVTTWPWLPSQWLWSILEHAVIGPHLSTDYLLAKAHLHPILLQQLQQLQATTATTTTSSGLTTVQQLWMLAGRLPTGQQMVATAIQQFAKDQGLQLVQQQQTKNPTAMISDLLQFQSNLSSMIASLQPHGPETIVLKSVWEDVVNAGPVEANNDQMTIAEALAKFLDLILRNNKKMDQYQSQSDQWLHRIISGLFVPIQAKDTFEGFYKNYLAKRLLWNRVVSMDVEKLVCSLLKTECGTGYTAKMEGMFQDIEFSRETMMVYKQSSTAAAAAAAANDDEVEMEVQVLTTGYWPVYKNLESLQLPPALSQPQERFTHHYKTKYQGRRMTWQYGLGHVVVRTHGFNKTYELVVSLAQALVLIQFHDETKRWTLPALQKVIGLPERAEMERLLQSLALGKDGTRILRKVDHDAASSSSKIPKKIRSAVHDNDLFCINTSFESNQRRIRIQNILMKETKEEREKTVEAVSRDRLYLIDAVLVRILKARKTILHQALLSQVMEQVKVPAQASDIKKRIESLIEREYMERDGKDRNRYNYLA